MNKNNICAIAALALTGLVSATAASAQSITVVREVDSDRYDPHRSTARGASEVLFMLVMVGFVVIYTFIDNFRRPDHSGLAKAAWALLIILLPLIGAVVYILARPEMRYRPPTPAV